MSRLAMGTEFQVILFCHDREGRERAELAAAASEALDQVERLEARLSHYLPDSEICDLNRRAAAEPVLLEPSLLDLLQRAQTFSEASEGAFDITVGALIKCWGFFRGRGGMPTMEAVEAARARCGYGWLELHPAERTARFRREGLEVHLGAFGKGYAVDQAVETLKLLGVEAALVHGGTSTLYALGAPPGRESWTVGVRDPRNRKRRTGALRLKDRALSISGDYEQYFEYEGHRYSHLLDPRTGWPARGTWSAAALGETAADTDALSTAAFVLGEAGTRRLAERYPSMGWIVIPEPETGEEPERVVLGDAELVSPDEFEEQDEFEG